MQQFYDVGKGRYVAPPAWHDGDAGDGSRCHLADCRYERGCFIGNIDEI